MGEKSYDEDSKNYRDAPAAGGSLFPTPRRALISIMKDKLDKSDKYAKDALDLLAGRHKSRSRSFQTPTGSRPRKARKRGRWAVAGLHPRCCGRISTKLKPTSRRASDLAVNPLAMLYIDRAISAAKQYDDAIVWADKAAASPNAKRSAEGYRQQRQDPRADSEETAAVAIGSNSR